MCVTDATAVNLLALNVLDTPPFPRQNGLGTHATMLAYLGYEHQQILLKSLATHHQAAAVLAQTWQYLLAS